MTENILIQINNLYRKGDVTDRITWSMSSVSARLVMAIMQFSRLAAAAYYPAVSPRIEIYITGFAVGIGIDPAAGRIVIGDRRTGWVGHRSGSGLVEKMPAKHQSLVRGIIKESRAAGSAAINDRRRVKAGNIISGKLFLRDASA